ncbi:hypothetical protein BDU57DRAFT_537000 [Ampelomyces quisqualis]|uniref:Zn(2)-C6 fungal-type domain-containing protein n=1 Tax=Ampelomyces quisqualis TaxID=50730 RepID=A0A6A5QPL1_AMPQU|nr:hypothetical protein BDU57DRAFT_537000 [Ampelomyces quisqualis]
MASATDTKPPALNLDVLIQALPACKRCRDCRRGCDTLLPKCRQCTKAGAECMFFDHGRNELLPRSYISELVDHVRRLSPRSDPSPATSAATPDDTNATNYILKTESDPIETSLHYEHHFAYAGHDYRYLGADSCLLRSPRMQPRKILSPMALDDDDDDWHLTWKKSSAKEWELLDLYLEVIQPVYPILDRSMPVGRYLVEDVPPDLTPTEIFTLNMIYSISCYILPNTGKKHDPQHAWQSSGRLSYHQANSLKYRALATEFYSKAMEHLEAATMDPNMATLRAVLLLAIHSSFDPKSGNSGQQIALAARLAFDLEQKGEVQELQPNEIEILHNMHMTIFSLENQVASTLDRPALFPEPNCELSFDMKQPAQYMCSLFRLQNRFRKGDYATKQQMKKLLPRLDERAELLPIVRISLHMTHLLLNPVWGSAWHVLEAVVSLGGIHVYVTPHWVYRAGTVLIQNMPAIFGGNLIQLYSNALLVLELSSWKWPSSATLSASLSDLMQHMKIKYRPDWSDTLQHGDVRI